MTQIRFVDADGTEGIVRSDLTLRYAGRFREEISAFIEKTLTRSGGSPASTPGIQGFAIELYATVPLSKLELVDREETARSDRDRFRDGVRPRRSVGRVRTRSTPSERRS
ncbi:hypothetical protein [Halalkalicoccus salilacus]|uniref:hypothetical protein n=1 Tax=Halalkalicoccus TaxID=332246 RepID=UPI002F968027